MPEPAIPSPPLSEADLDLLRILCCVAWADGEFCAEERTLLGRLAARYFTAGSEGRLEGEELEALAAQALPPELLDELPRRLAPEDRPLALKLAYQMIRVGRREGDAASINAAEKVAYRRLVEALALGETEIREAEWAAEQELEERQGLVAILLSRFRSLGAWPEGDLLEEPGAPRL